MEFWVKPQVFHQFSFPQVGQCNDAYGAVVIATKLAEALECGLDRTRKPRGFRGSAWDSVVDVGKTMP